jgi:hypothetical protein
LQHATCTGFGNAICARLASETPWESCNLQLAQICAKSNDPPFAPNKMCLFCTFAKSRTLAPKIKIFILHFGKIQDVGSKNKNFYFALWQNTGRWLQK